MRSETGSELIEGVDIVEGTFTTLYQSNWRNRFREEIDMATALGHRAFKVEVRFDLKA